jgi:hypothetical protein
MTYGSGFLGFIRFAHADVSLTLPESLPRSWGAFRPFWYASSGWVGKRDARYTQREPVTGIARRGLREMLRNRMAATGFPFFKAVSAARA